jgi:hypothetical protein
MKKLLLIFSFILIGTGFLLLTIYLFKPQALRKGYHYFTRLFIRQEIYHQPVFSVKLNDNLLDYYNIARSRGIQESSNELSLNKKFDNEKIVKVSSGKYYIIDKMRYSYPCITKNSKILLDEIGKRFNEKISRTKLRHAKFIVTSMTRTTEQNKKLQKLNSNTSVKSPHLYGNSFDIAYLRYKCRRQMLTSEDKNFLKEALAETIWQLKKEGQCWATLEKGQYCFHVVAK